MNEVELLEIHCNSEPTVSSKKFESKSNLLQAEWYPSLLQVLANYKARTIFERPTHLPSLHDKFNTAIPQNDCKQFQHLLPYI